MDEPVDGWTADGFAPVHDELARALADGTETRAAVAASVDGELVVDLWGGWRDFARTQPWQRDTIAMTYSVTKVPAAVTVLTLVDRGLLTLDQPVADVWPEYAAEGKGRTTLRHVLAHQAGLPAFPPGLVRDAWHDPRALSATLAAEKPEWEPGSAHAEHALTYGALLGELLRRADGRTLGQVWRQDVARPHDLDVAIRLQGDEAARAADMQAASPQWSVQAVGEPGTLRHRALSSPAGACDVELLNSGPWRRAEVAAINGHRTARALAQLYAALLTDELLSPSVRQAMLSPVARGRDLLVDDEVTWGLGPQLDDDGWLGMGGLGGSLGLGHPERGLSFGFVTRRLADHARADALLAAFEACL